MKCFCTCRRAYFVTELLIRAYLEENYKHSEGTPETPTSRIAERIGEGKREVRCGQETDSCCETSEWLDIWMVIMSRS